LPAGLDAPAGRTERNRFLALYVGMKTRSLLVGLAMSVVMAGALIGSVFGDAPGAPVGKRSFDAALIARGAQLSAIGNCATCHTRRSGKSFAGGLPLATPFGVVYSTNITPDVGTGIGAWTEADFLRAMHDGVDRAGRNLYPAFPYDHFTRVTDDDVGAIYAYIMTRDAVHSLVPANRLMFPMTFRPLLSGWKALYFERGAYRPDPGRSAEWNRGAYLVEGLGHCGACHTPRNALGAERKSDPLGGGDVEGWRASAINASSSAPMPWTIDQLTRYLRQGRDDTHGTAAGPMAPVVHQLSQVPEEDVRAMATYLTTAMAGSAPASGRATAASPDEARLASGAAIFAGTCASCHDEGASSFSSVHTVPLALTTSIHEPDPRNVLHIVLEGIWPEPGEKGAQMPGFEGALTDEQLASLLTYVRAHFVNSPPWPDVSRQARDIIQHKDENER
jgi:mono/diheme cytochrome c family protein